MKRIAIYGALLLLATMSVLAKSNNAASFLPNHTGEWTSAPKHTPTTLTPDGAICGNGDIGMVFGGNSQHQVIYFSKTDFWKALNGYPNGGLCLVGRLNIRANGLSGASYHITQSINHATVSGSFANALTSYNMEAWCAATSNLAVVRLTAGNAPVQLSVDFESDTGRGATVKSGRKGYIAWTTRQFLGDSLLWESGVSGHFTDPDFAGILLNEINGWDGPNEFSHYEWRDARWDNMSNGIETYFTSAARLGYDGEKLLAKLKERIAKTAQTNMWVTQGGGGIECFSAVPSCINEMLLQGYEGIIRLFPVWPKNRPASFSNLRTHGAFLVSSSCSNNAVECATIVSLKGRPCKLLNPWKEQGCTVVRADGKRFTTTDSIISLTTSPNEVLKLMPTTSAHSN